MILIKVTSPPLPSPLSPSRVSSPFSSASSPSKSLKVSKPRSSSVGESGLPAANKDRSVETIVSWSNETKLWFVRIMVAMLMILTTLFPREQESSGTGSLLRQQLQGESFLFWIGWKWSLSVAQVLCVRRSTRLRWQRRPCAKIAGGLLLPSACFRSPSSWWWGLSLSDYCAFHYQVHVGCHEDHLVSKTKKYETMTKCNFQVCRKSDEILCTICGKELSCKCLLNVSSDRSCDEEHNYIIAMIVLMIMMIIVSFF